MDCLKLKYFVLKPHGDDIYAAASRKAMRTYAHHIEQLDPLFAKELVMWVNAERAEIVTANDDRST